MNFALTVRDNNVNGGQYAVANTIVTTSSNIGPFVVTSQNTNVNWESGSQQTVTWDVAGTTNSPVNTSMVNIYFQTTEVQALIMFWQLILLMTVQKKSSCRTSVQQMQE